MRIIVTGGCGRVRLSTVEKLLNQKINVLTLDIQDPTSNFHKNKYF